MSLSILLRCFDIEQTREFYESVLCCVVASTAENTITVTKGGAHLIFTSQDLWSATPGFSGTIYITVADVDQYFSTIASKASVAWPLQTMPYGGREFAITDCNGYLLAFQQEGSRVVRAAPCRMA
ncbi:VOC family protein [Variovorax ginsengisoli]|uniref:Glyoxalase superfamily protein PhnB n=1 Tax=Variovorax ginsengisoli TaxID=363844 RepID=A0ABT9S5P7_9BURK|nr:VOC family protein [Variovorax ginsengisoli]MDP9899697.1 putative glyoxalase superfamily protein PhnB [Variovorax ginsengisoli]